MVAACSAADNNAGGLPPCPTPANDRSPLPPNTSFLRVRSSASSPTAASSTSRSSSSRRSSPRCRTLPKSCAPGRQPDHQGQAPGGTRGRSDSWSRPDLPTPPRHYNLACRYALLKQPDLAFGSLRKAIELGYRDFRFMEEDRDLDSIRKDPRFRALVKEYRGRKK